MSLDIEYSQPLEQLKKLLSYTTDIQALEVLRLFSNELESLTQETALQARNNGSSWQEIGDALHLSKQAVHARYALIR